MSHILSEFCHVVIQQQQQLQFIVWPSVLPVFCLQNVHGMNCVQYPYLFPFK